MTFARFLQMRPEKITLKEMKATGREDCDKLVSMAGYLLKKAQQSTEFAINYRNYHKPTDPKGDHWTKQFAFNFDVEATELN